MTKGEAKEAFNLGSNKYSLNDDQMKQHNYTVHKEEKPSYAQIVTKNLQPQARSVLSHPTVQLYGSVLPFLMSHPIVSFCQAILKGRYEWSL